MTLYLPSTYGRGMSTRDRLIESTQDLLWERGYVGLARAADSADRRSKLPTT